MQRAEINGTALFWDDVPGPFTAHLLVGTGLEDDPFPRFGITELVEQLAVTAVADAGRDVDELDSTVAGDHTRFRIVGEPERVAEAVNRLCRALAGPPVDGLAGAARRVRARRDRERGWEGFQERELSFRYGLRGPGRNGWDAPAVERIGADDVRAWAAARFTRGNAALVLTGAPPKALDPRLPDGPRIERPVVAPLPGTSGCWLEAPHEWGERVAVSYEAPASPAGHVAAELARERALRDPRVAGNLTGDVEIHSSYTGGGRMLFWLVAETDEPGVQAVADGLDGLLRELAADGPAEEEVRRVERIWSDRLEGEEQRRTQLFVAGLDHLCGLDFLDTPILRARLAAFGPGDVRAALAAYPSTALLVLPAHCEPGEGSPFVPEPDPAGQDLHEAYAYRPRLFGPAGRHARMYLSDEGLAHWTGRCHHVVRWHQVAGVGVAPGRRVVFGEQGGVIDIEADWYKSGGDLVAAVDARLPASLRFPIGEGEPI
ncbi:hypothetical protein [Streptomyces roseoviridis]|uniref:Peptidase M16 C-terminal domain-containing protein n=1 Tax=Streptomyces roseoviridis TaxID=67361 RepID=A0ABV5QQ05_9ACTN